VKGKVNEKMKHEGGDEEFIVPQKEKKKNFILLAQ
jgi:hypothetical protein